VWRRGRHTRATDRAQPDAADAPIPWTRRGRWLLLAFVPSSLLTNMAANGALHEQVYVVTIVTADSPLVLAAERATCIAHPCGLSEVLLHYGFMEKTLVADDLYRHFYVEPVSTHYFLGRENVHASRRVGMARWREVLFSVMNKNVGDVGAFFHLPEDRVVEVGNRVEI